MECWKQCLMYHVGKGAEDMSATGLVCNGLLLAFHSDALSGGGEEGGWGARGRKDCVTRSK